MDFTEAKTEWEQFKSSKVVKALITMESAAVALFVQQVIAGEQKLDFQSVKGWLVVQAAIILAALFRHTQAGIEAKLDGQVDPAIVKSIEDAAQKRVVAELAKKDPGLAAMVSKQFSADVKPEGE